MGFKNAAQRKAVWASKNEQKKGSPAKQKIEVGKKYPVKIEEFKPDKLPKNLDYEWKMTKKGLKDLATNYLDWNDDGKIGTGDIGKEAASWLLGGAVGKFALKGLGQGYKFVKGALKRESSSPFNHCDSEMMHSGGWGQVRKYNSPGTTGNKEGIKHNEKMREEIGTFKMPHSPLNKGHEVNKDSIAAAKAWKAHKAAYLKKPGGKEEYDREKGEFYYSPKHGKLRLIPTDDGEVQDRSGIEKWQLAPDRKSSALHQMSEAEKR